VPGGGDPEEGVGKLVQDCTTPNKGLHPMSGFPRGNRRKKNPRSMRPRVGLKKGVEKRRRSVPREARGPVSGRGGVTIMLRRLQENAGKTQTNTGLVFGTAIRGALQKKGNRNRGVHPQSTRLEIKGTPQKMFRSDTEDAKKKGLNERLSAKTAKGRAGGRKENIADRRGGGGLFV